MLINYLKLAYNIITVIAIVFFIFHPKDVLGFWVINIKKVCLNIWKLLKKIFNK
jgi:hypothetical protein